MARYIRNYEIVRELGAGHFGAVYLAVGEVPARGPARGTSRGRPTNKPRLVAIKKLKNAADQESVELLRQEFALLEQVKHRCIIRVFEYLEDENAVVMEYVHGVTLRTALEELRKAKEQIFTEAAVEIGCELADGLFQAYTTPGDNGEPLQLVHRDLKPANVMLTPAGEVKILDFGLARVDNADFARDNRERIRGTPIYMAPEQARGQEIDHRTDLFALGLILYELLMGEAAYRVPENAKDPAREVFRAIESGDLSAQCRSLETRLPALGPVLTRALQRRPEDRYRHGHDMLVDLRRQLYRDQGAYLQEFCDFFFGEVHDLAEAPTAEGLANAARSRTRSIEERLRESMARDKRAQSQIAGAPAASAGSAAAAGPSPGPPPSPAAAPRVPPPPPARPSSIPASPASSPNNPGAPMASNDNGSGRKPAPPVGGGASRAQPFVPASAGAGGKVKAIGERRPDETGMLQMVPLDEGSDEAAASGDPSATAFFAIPAPKAARARPAPDAAPMGGGGLPPPNIGQGGALPPPPIAPPNAGVNYGQGIGSGMPQGGGSPIAQGPVAGYGGAGGGYGGGGYGNIGYGNAAGGTPFQVSGPIPGSSAPPPATSRTTSYQVYAIVLGVFALVCLAGVLTVATIVYKTRDKEPEEPPKIASNTSPTPSPTVEPPPEEEPIIEEDAPPSAPPRRTPRNPPSGTPSPQPSTPKAPPVSSGSLTIRLADAPPASTAEVVCPSNFRTRASFSGGSATLKGIPNESCTVFFKGSITGKYSPVRGGTSLTCSIVGTTATCN